MKVLSIIIPSYNSQDYLHRCINSLNLDDERLEVLIINDGSGDNTAKIADELEQKYPKIIRAIHQENKGHGGAVNTGIANAKGLYIKVLDSDDKLNKKALKTVVDTIADNLGERDNVDMYISNFVYDKVGKIKKKRMIYSNAFPENRIFDWDESKKLKVGQYILMHSVIYRTKLLKDCNLLLPEHTFYVDNIFVFYPLPYVKKLFYINVDLYYYFIGREDQSVNEQVMTKRISQQLFVNKLMIEMYSQCTVKCNKLRKYMIAYLSTIMAVSSILLIKIDTEEALEQKLQLWEYLKQKDAKAYRLIRRSALGNAINLKGRSGRKISLLAYKIAQMIYGFN